MAGVDETEPARAGAALAVDHEGGRAVGPALEDVRAAGFLAHGDEREIAHRLLQADVVVGDAQASLGMGGLARLDRQAAGDAGLLESAEETQRLVVRRGPDDILTVDPRAPPSLHGSRDDRVDDGAHVGGDAFGRQRGDRLVGDAARDDVVEEREIGIDVEREPVHRAPAAQLHADRRDLAVLDPHARIPVEASGAAHAEIGERVDQQLLDGAHVRDRVGHAAAALPRHGEDRIADELAGAVIRDVATSIGAHELGAHVRGRHEHVAHVGAHAERVDVRMLEQQQSGRPSSARTTRAATRAHRDTAPARATEPAALCTLKSLQSTQSVCHHGICRGHSSWDQSRVSRSSLTWRRNAVA